MSTIREDFEALLPEPHWAPGYSGPLPEGAYSADQVREAMKAVAERCAVLCEGEQDLSEETRALKKFQDASGKGMSEELARGNHWSTVSLFNTGLKRAAAAIRAQTGGAG